VQDLIDEIDKVKEGNLSIELIRKGEKKTVEITPEKRPPIEPLRMRPSAIPPRSGRTSSTTCSSGSRARNGRPSMKFRFWRQPGHDPSRPTESAEKLPRT